MSFNSKFPHNKPAPLAPGMLAELFDFDNKPINIGDVFLIAAPRKHGDVNYSTMIVTGRTKGMLRAMKIMDWDDKQFLLGHIESYANTFQSQPRHKGALIASWNTYKLASSVLTEKEVLKAIENGVSGKSSTLQQSTAQVFTSSSLPWSP